MQTRSNRWLICGFLFFATLVNYLDRQTISVSASKIAAEMHLTDVDLGRLFFGFLFAYGITQILIGSFLDRLGTVGAYAIAVAAWSIAGATSGFATGFGFLFATRVALGVCEAPNWPLAMRTVTRVFPPEQRTLATGLFQSGTSLGALIAPPFIIYIATAYNWRMSFFVVGAIGFLWVALWLLWFRARPEPMLGTAPSTSSDENAPSRPTAPVSIRVIARSRMFWGLVLCSTFINPLQYFYTTWLPRYFDKYAGLGFGSALAERLVIVYLALDLGLWSGGLVVARLSKHWDVRRARLFVTSVGTGCMMTVPLVSKFHNIDAITAIISLAVFGLGWFIANYLVFSAEIFPANVSTMVGIVSGLGSLAGAGFMLLIGGSIEKSGSFAIAFTMVGLMPLISLTGLWFGSRPATNPAP